MVGCLVLGGPARGAPDDLAAAVAARDRAALDRLIVALRDAGYVVSQVELG